MTPPLPHKNASWLLPGATGLAAAIIASLGYWIPSAWRDEVATSYVVSHPLDEIFSLSEHTDAAFAAYYAVMHFWAGVFGADVPTLRVPSIIAVGWCAAAVVATMRRLAGPRVAVTAGFAAAFLPRLTAMGIEARPYALCAALTAWCAYAVVRATDGDALGSPSRRPWRPAWRPGVRARGSGLLGTPGVARIQPDVGAELGRPPHATRCAAAHRG